ncbi:RNA-directed DNA polymerase from mobile element jockey [Trichonephila inaurata madagascariensis]|uniref:RNA-directed DNA polymerase from mobile element jockey n=1 Tax=Trichonephila inaurata madagascariensis TaxID=2747483 RepID=A0A8X6JPV3_9ARAC|nr:RNA-directed DNA polymerase from mobile element jockey [Trichonephila inaurata madagascariensis]
MEQLLVAVLLPATNAVVRSTPVKHVRQNGESVQTARRNTLLIPKSVQNGSKKKKYKELKYLKTFHILKQRNRWSISYHPEPPVLMLQSNVYLPPNAPLNFRKLQELIDQFPSPFILLGDFNAHHLLWGCQDVNSRGKIVEKLLTELNLTLLNDGSNTYFHSPTQSFSAID